MCAKPERRVCGLFSGATRQVCGMDVCGQKKRPGHQLDDRGLGLARIYFDAASWIRRMATGFRQTTSTRF